jgi:hypothetical protein
MYAMFQESQFNGDIGKWDVTRVTEMDFMFGDSQFNSDLSGWKPYSLAAPDNIFHNSKAPIPYWNEYYDKDERKKAIDSYWLQKELGQELVENNKLGKKPKI